MKRTALLRQSPMQRTGPIRMKPRRRPVVDWDALREAVVRRDVSAIVVHVRRLFVLEEVQAIFSRGRLVIFGAEWCVAAMVDPAELGKCSGRWTLNHVQDPGDPMYGRKVPDEEGFLVSLCAWHHQGSKAGHVWATASENLQLQWTYLEERHERERAAAN